ncbi:MAG: hypothetical protein LBH95_04125 [Oscillospiraceae bacterium]|nr:hypothetical protein [Oscillospiraceae bacterium]
MKRSNILIAVLSLVLACGLWGYVVLYRNPEGDKEVAGIPVEFINEPALSPRSLILTGGRDATVRVRFTGRVQNLVNINKETVKAVVDLKNVANAGERPMEYELQGPPELVNLDVNRVDPLVTVTIDTVTHKYVALRLDLPGGVSEGYMRDPAVFEPSQIQITGPTKELDTVYEAVARYAPAEPIARSVTDLPINYVLQTESGQVVQSDHITADYEEVRLSIPVYMVKAVKLVIDFLDGGGITNKNIIYSVTPDEVRISGDPGELAGLNTLSLTQIDLASLQGDLDEIYKVWLPDGVRNLDGVDTAEASVRITGAATRDIEATNITIRGLVLPEGTTYNLLTRPVTVTVRGPEEDVARVDPVNVRVTADFSGEAITSTGRYTRPGAVLVDNFDTVGAIDKGYEVTIDVIPLEAPP